jgi:hypothetical protein
MWQSPSLHKPKQRTLPLALDQYSFPERASLMLHGWDEGRKMAMIRQSHFVERMTFPEASTGM